MSTLPIHPMAALFPMLPEDDLRALADDIKVNGQHEPVVLFDGQVLDGRNRLAACELAGVEPRTRIVTSCPDPLAFVLSANLHRRHLNESQRAVLAAKVKPMLAEQARARQVAAAHATNATLGRAETVSANLREPSDAGKSADQAAQIFDVASRSVETAARVLRDGAPELVTAVERGDVAVSAAAELTALPVEEQREVVAGGKDAIKAKVKEIRDSKPKREGRTQPVTRSPGQLAEEKIRAATTPQELDAAYQEASNAGLSDRECEAVAEARQKRGAELRAQATPKADTPTPAAAPPPTEKQGNLFTEQSVPVCTQAASSQPKEAATVTVDAAVWEAMKAENEALRAEVTTHRAWIASLRERAEQLPILVKNSTPNLDRARKLVELAGSPNENEARSAAMQACRMIREQGIRLASDNPLVSSDPLDLALRGLYDAAVRAGVQL